MLRLPIERGHEGAMKAELIAIVIIYAGFALAEAISTGFFRKGGATRQDAVVEIFGLMRYSTLVS